MRGTQLRQLRNRLRFSQAALGGELSVTPNTVARWEREESPIPAATAEFVRVLVRDRTSGAFLVPGLDGTRLSEWSKRRDSESRLPDLIRSLVVATTTRPSRAEFRGGDGIQIGGWDGIVEIDSGNLFVPDGKSGWELSTQNEKKKAKADADYEKRTSDPGCDPAETTYVCLTLTRWSKKDEWAAKRRADDRWKDVRVYDADDLEQWLEYAPGVALALAKQLGLLPPSGVTTLEDYWFEWCAGTKPEITPELVLAGREKAEQLLLASLEAAPAVISIDSNSQEEAVAFTIAALMGFKGSRGREVRARALLVSETGTWRVLSSSPENLILIPGPGVEASAVPGAPAGGHHAIAAVRGSRVASTIKLPPLNTDILKERLVFEGVSEQEAQSLARGCGRRATVLKRQLSSIPNLLVPEWAADPKPCLLAALLIGSWHESCDRDKAAIEGIAGAPYQDFAAEIVSLSASADAPIKANQGVWTWVSREDSWVLLRRFLGSELLSRFQDLAIDALSEQDPCFDLPVDKRWVVSPSAEKRYSNALREGVAETLALLGALTPSDEVSDSMDPGVRAAICVRDVLKARDWRRWATLSTILPLLAEAAPDGFFDAVGALAEAEGEAAQLFSEDGGSMGGVPQAGLLWALESLAWNSEYLARAACTLGGLARLDPGGRYSNRPVESLKEIFVGWRPQTCASLAVRFDAIDALLRSEPAVGWTLLVDLIPRSHEMSGQNHRPRWRDWTSGWNPGISHSEFLEWVNGVCARAIDLVGRVESPWPSLLTRLSDLPPEFCNKAIAKLEDAAKSIVSLPERLAIWQALRDLLHHHRSVPGADWILPEAILCQISDVYDLFEPASPLDRFKWLFSHRPHLPTSAAADYDQADQAIEEARMLAVQVLLKSGGVADLIDLAEQVDRPDLIGAAAAVGDSTEIETSILSTTLGKPKTAQRALGFGYVGSMARSAGSNWIATQIEGSHELRFSPEQLADFFCALPFEHSTWEMLQDSDDAVAPIYWQRVQAFPWMDGACDHLPFVVDALLAADRAEFAVQLAYTAVHRQAEGTTVEPDLLVRILRALASSQSEHTRSAMAGGDLAHDLAEIFNALASSRLDRTVLAELEWTYLPLFGEHTREPVAIMERIGRDPAFFAEIVEVVYRKEGDTSDSDSSDNEQAIAARGWRLLRQWRKTPGVGEDGIIRSDELSSWIERARHLCLESNRLKVADSTIGGVLAHAPADENGLWPAIPVREVIEAIGTQSLRDGLYVGILNLRGVTRRAHGEGGQQERELANKYRAWSAQLSRWPLTAAVLREVSDRYELDAEREDDRADSRLDR